MRGIVYRLGRRRTGSVLVALGAALTFALSSVAGASAKTVTPAFVIPVPAHMVLVTSVRPPAKVVQVVQVLQVAHAAGHKIA
jgi:hypothetical protein